jgi:putative phosphoesterase
MALMSMRIGVLSDSHVPDILSELPPRVCEIFNGVDLIFHAGDISSLAVLQQLEPIAQTFAVYGDRDNWQIKHYLQEKQRLDFARRSVGLVHGHRAWQVDVWTRVIYHFNPSLRSQALFNHVLREFAGEHVDAIVFGHSHTPYIKVHGSVLLFNPGSVVPRNGQPGTVGLLEVSQNAIKGRIVTV